jgi:chemotaxis protein methyltransferase CheR
MTTGTVAAGARQAQGRGPAHDDDLEGLEVELLLEAIDRADGMDFRHYAPRSLRRRLRRRVEAEQVGTVSGLLDRVLHEPACFSRLLDDLSVTTTAMFRDPAFYRALRTRVAPVLRTYPSIRVWSAGCSTGEEVYSIAILSRRRDFSTGQGSTPRT